MNKSYHAYILVVLFVGLPLAHAQPISPRVVDRLENSVVLEWQHGPVPSGTYQLFLMQNNVLVPTSGGGQNSQVVTAPPPLNPGGLVTTRSNEILRPELAYRAVISGPPPGQNPGVDINIFVPPFQKNGGPSPGGGPPIVALPDDPLARRIEASAQMVTAQGDFLRAIGENRLLRAEAERSLAEARAIVAEAVDLELDNWKKHVVIYFDRREENLLGEMRIRELDDIRADQALEYRDKAARRRYEYLNRYTGNSVGSHDNLNFMLDLFVGTSLGYGIQLEELVDSTVDHSRWNLTPDMMRQLRVRTPNAGGKHIEFQLNQPEVIAMHWPSIFQQPQFRQTRNTAQSLIERLSESENREEQNQIINQLSDGFALLSHEFFNFFGPHLDRSNWSTEQFQQYLRAEEFLAQKNRELSLFRENPESAIRASRTFDPQRHGKDVGTLIAWMNGGGLKFVKPRPGDEDAYLRIFNIMKELYAVLGEPIMAVEKTKDQPSIAPDPNGALNQFGDPGRFTPPTESRP